MTRFLAHINEQTLLADLAQAGFVFTNPQPFEQTSNGIDSAIWLDHVLDEEGNPSAEFCANVTACEGITFSTEIPAPTIPYNVWA